MDARHAQHDDPLARALYRKLFSAAAARQYRAVARASPVSSCARPYFGVALSKIVRIKFSAGPIRRRGAGCIREAGIGFLSEKVDKAAVERGCEPRPLEDQGRI